MSWQPEQYDPRQHEQRLGGQPYPPQQPYQQQPPPGYGMPPYAPPPRRRSWAARHKIATGFLALCGLILVIGIASALASPASSAPPSYTPAAAPAAHSSSAAAQTVTYVVTGSAADITYGPAGSDLSGSVPMRITRPLGSPAYYDISAQLNGSGTVSCKIEINGHVISQATAAGSYNIASCEITQDPLTGQWQDANS